MVPDGVARSLASRLKLRQLALAVAIAARGSLRQAAADVAMTQPAATKLLRALEHAVGLPLFTRHAWGMAPTAYGETLVRYARGMLSELDRARDELAALAQGRSGVLRVGGVTGAVPRLLAPAIRRVRSERPGVKLFVLVNASEVLLDALSQGTLDVAVCPLPGDADLASFVVRALAEEPLSIVARAGHPLARRRSVPLSALAGADWLLQPAGSPQRQDVDAMLAAAGLRSPGALIETVSIVATLALLQEGNAISVMPQALAQHYARHGMVAELPMILPVAPSRYALVTRARRELSPAAQVFVALLESSAAAGVRRSRR